MTDQTPAPNSADKRYAEICNNIRALDQNVSTYCNSSRWSRRLQSWDCRFSIFHFGCYG